MMAMRRSGRLRQAGGRGLAIRLDDHFARSFLQASQRAEQNPDDDEADHTYVKRFGHHRVDPVTKSDE